MTTDPPPSHRLSRAVLAVAIAAVVGLGVTLFVLTGADDALLRAGTALATRIRNAWPA